MKYANILAPPKKPSATYNMTAEAVQNITEDSYRKGMISAVPIVNAMYSAAMLFYLDSHTELDNNGVRDFFTGIQKYFEEICADELSYTDVVQALLEERGINLVIESVSGEEEAAIDIFKRIDKEKYPVSKLKWRNLK